MNINDDSHGQLGEGVIYKDFVPLRWRELGQDEPAVPDLRIQDANEEVLRFIAILDEFHIDGNDEPGSNSGLELNRIEFKLNLLLDMVTQLVTRETDIPETAPITLGAAGIEWIEQKPPKEGGLVELSLHLHHKYPRPFIVTGQVLNVTPVEGEGGKYRVCLVFKEMSEVLQAGLEKFIFRQHRRSIAQSRRAVNTADVIS